jgi:hypothetical protein
MTLKKAVWRGNPGQPHYIDVLKPAFIFSFFCQRHFFMTVHGSLPWHHAGD